MRVVLTVIAVFTVIQIDTSILGRLTSWHARIVYPHVLLLGSLHLPQISFMVSTFLAASRKLQGKLFKEDWRKKEAGPILQECRLLWLQLNKLSCNFCCICYRACISAVLFCILVMITASYGAFAGLTQHGMSNKRTILAGPAIVSFASGYYVANKLQLLRTTVTRFFLFFSISSSTTFSFPDYYFRSEEISF